MLDLSWLMVIINLAAVVVLGLAILYGTRMWRKRPKDRRTKEAADEATWRLYHPPEESGEKPRGPAR